MTDRYDIVIIGAGSGGLVGARFAAQLGARVALIEKNRIGGDCTWTGCVPSKALIKVAKVAHAVRTAHHYGVGAGSPTVNMSAVREYVRRAIASVYRFETPEALAREKIDVLFGGAQFLDANTIKADGRTICSKKFLLTTGARPVIPAIPGLRDVPFITYEKVFENDALPERLAILGGGPIGMEMAQAYQRLGSHVTIISNSVLPKEDTEVQSLMKGALEREGVRFILERPKSVQKQENATAIVTQHSEIQSDLLLVAVGRRPNLDGLALEKAGVKYSTQGIPVDDRLRTNAKHIYAAGDVTGGYQFTHYAGWQAFQAVRNALLPGSSSGVSSIVPRVTFTDPEVAHVGATESQLRATQRDGIQVHRWDMGKVDRAICEDDQSGFLKIIAKPDGTILGATLVAARAGDAIVELIVAMKQGMKAGDLSGTIHPYPTYSTAIQLMAADITLAHLLSGTSGKLVRGLSRLFTS
jgi:pyruvate/2-oxoglutarate dehydrogenase complex dihydrolipoamide dehydrogenase (E3) component